MNWKRDISTNAVATISVLAVMAALHFFLLREEPVGPGIEANIVPMYYQPWNPSADQGEFDIDGELARLELDDAQRDRQIRDFLHRQKYAQARTLLLEVAAAAVVKGNQDKLGDTLLLLGEVAINQQELAAAEIYLQEALYLTISRDNLLGTARCYQLLGQLNIRARELARRAAITYDQLWQARNSIARGYYQGVNENLQAVIEENMNIRRYGAAADAWEAMASLHDQVHDGYQAQQARLEAARLFASTGQMTHVYRLLENIDHGLISDSDLAQVESEINDLFQQHQQDLIQSSQARDYQMLYHHYLRIGQLERAWEFRIKSSETLASASDRSVFQRQADIIAVLYNSNFAMDRAKSYLDQAERIYGEEGASEMLQQTQDMGTQIW
jgi:hypothetical protein